MSGQAGEGDAATRTPSPGTVAVVTMGKRPAAVALWDGQFWRSCDAFGPIQCKPPAITSIETPYVFSPASSGGAA